MDRFSDKFDQADAEGNQNEGGSFEEASTYKQWSDDEDYEGGIGENRLKNFNYSNMDDQKLFTRCLEQDQLLRVEGAIKPGDYSPELMNKIVASYFLQAYGVEEMRILIEFAKEKLHNSVSNEITITKAIEETMKSGDHGKGCFAYKII